MSEDAVVGVTCHRILFVLGEPRDAAVLSSRFVAESDARLT
jgi:hypothetical protein